MKKWIALLLSTVLVFTVLVTALAENQLRFFYDAAMNLLFETNNVTLTGHAEFFLDGKRFKTADLNYIQDYTNSYYQLKLLTPRRDGSHEPDRESGYTIIANGENVYVMEVIYPGVYKTGSTYAQNTILRKSVQMNLMTNVLSVLMDQSNLLLGEQAFTVQPDGQGGRELTITIKENVPDLVNTALNIFYQFVAKRYFDTDYDKVKEQDMALMENYLTVSQGILSATKSVSLKQINVTVQANGHGLLERVSGDITLLLDTGRDGTRELGITFYLNVSDIDGSHVEKFDPSAYGVKLAKGYQPAEKTVKTMDSDTEKRFLEASKARWWLAGYTIDDTMKGSVLLESDAPQHQEEWIYVDFANEDGPKHLQYFTNSIGQMLGLMNVKNAWQGENNEYHFEEYSDKKLVQETEEKLLKYLADENPDLAAMVTKLETNWWYQEGENLYLHYWEEPENLDRDAVDFVVRVAPEWRIEFFSCVGNG